MKLRTLRKTRVSLDIGENYKDPAEFRDLVVLADELGFDTAWLGDHFMPWFHSGNKSSFVWSLVGPCLERTRSIKVGPFVTTPIGGRYHPAIVAQAVATLDNMYPGRVVVAVGSGEAMNEVPFFQGGTWPSWEERTERLVEGVRLMRRLWESDDYFDFDGKYFPMKQVFLYTKPKTSLGVYFSAIGPKAATKAGEIGAHLVTLNSRNDLDRCRNVIFPEFEQAARKHGKDPSKLEKVVSLSFAVGSREEVIRGGREAAGIIARGSLAEPDPRRIQDMGNRLVSDEDIVKATHICASWEEAVDYVNDFAKLGVAEVVLPSGSDAGLIRRFAEEILPQVK
jgi:G6PDH family F420-dependent oxidoreductase